MDKPRKAVLIDTDRGQEGAYVVQVAGDQVFVELGDGRFLTVDRSLVHEISEDRTEFHP